MKKLQNAYAPLFPYLATAQNAILAPGELIIDNFAGLCGASTGLEQALGRPVDVAINHSRQAIELHSVNHPYTRHYVEDVWEVNPLEVTGGQPVALAWFSPTCTHFSKAKGSGLLDRKIRGLAWVTLRWADLVKPRVIILENVEEFQGWGPLTKDGRPDPKQKGRTFRSFVNALRYQGYQVEHRELRASEYGAPTIRKRLFLIARRDGLPIVWPEATHAAPTSSRVLSGELKTFRTAAECIDWELPTPSIFTRKKPLVPATGPHGLVAAQLVTYYGPKREGEVRGLLPSDPLKTQGTENRFALLTASLVKHYGGTYQGAGVSLASPVATITSVDHHALLTGHLIGIDNQSSKGGFWNVRHPLNTIVTESRHGLVSGALVACGGRGAQARPKAINEVMHTITSKADMCLTSAHLQAYYSSNGKGDLGQEASDPLRTVPTTDRFGVTAATLMRQFGTSTAADVAAPLGTIVSGGNGKTHLVMADCQPDLSTEQLARARQVYALLAQYAPEALNRHADHAQQLVVLQVRGEWYVLADIGMRMLSPRELAACQGFPETYKLDATLDGKPLSKAAQVRGIGNSVCPDLARVIAFSQLTAQADAAD
jgi:DNA (cytosine-5)-methyltransferase 1